MPCLIRSGDAAAPLGLGSPWDWCLSLLSGRSSGLLSAAVELFFDLNSLQMCNSSRAHCACSLSTWLFPT